MIGNKPLRWGLKIAVALFSAGVCTIGLLLPYKARKQYSHILVRFKETINVIF
ncbi:MAG: hypothetical protein QME81_12400 [bacterium]|nr:hypothetical protein [bacterium]